MNSWVAMHSAFTPHVQLSESAEISTSELADIGVLSTTCDSNDACENVMVLTQSMYDNASDSSGQMLTINIDYVGDEVEETI